MSVHLAAKRLINALNLLDLRPGRAGKFFLVTVALLLIMTWRRQEPAEYLLPIIVLGSVAGYIGWDLQGRVMMGDTGANMLGACLGLTSVWLLPDYVLLVEAALLIGLHLFCERFSISEVVERYPVLRYLDGLGRTK